MKHLIISAAQLRGVSEQSVLSTGLTTTQALKLTSVDVLINLFTWQLCSV